MILLPSAREAVTFVMQRLANILDCHPPHARGILEGMLEKGFENAYMIEKNGKKKLIYQAPWFENGKQAGLFQK